MELDSNLVSVRKFHSRWISRVAGGSASKRSYSKWLLGFSELFVRNIVVITGILGFCKLLPSCIIEHRNLVAWSFQLFASTLQISAWVRICLRMHLHHEIFYINIYTREDYVHRKNGRDNKTFSKYESHKRIIEASPYITWEIIQSYYPYYPMPWDTIYIILFMQHGCNASTNVDVSVQKSATIYRTACRVLTRRLDFPIASERACPVNRAYSRIDYPQGMEAPPALKKDKDTRWSGNEAEEKAKRTGSSEGVIFRN